MMIIGNKKVVLIMFKPDPAIDLACNKHRNRVLFEFRDILKECGLGAPSLVADPLFFLFGK